MSLSLLALAAQAELFIYETESGARIVTEKPLRQVTNLKLISYGQPGDQLYRSPEAPLEDQFDVYIQQSAMLYGVERSLIKAVIKAESNFDDRAQSEKGAMGLMQLMPATAEQYRVQDPFDAKTNIDAGTRHLRYLLNVFNQNLAWALAAYNAGESAVREYQGIPPFDETVDYVQKVIGYYQHYQ